MCARQLFICLFLFRFYFRSCFMKRNLFFLFSGAFSPTKRLNLLVVLLKFYGSATKTAYYHLCMNELLING